MRRPARYWPFRWTACGLKPSRPLKRIKHCKTHLI